MKNLPKCSHCGTELSDYRNTKCRGCFYKNHPNKIPEEIKTDNRKKYKAKWFQKNKQKIYNNYVKRLETDPKKIKSQRFKYYIKSKFGITIDEYQRLLENQNGQCAICGYKEPQGATRHDRLYVDHNHDSGAIRGLLCMHCNAGIGHFKENLTILKNAIQYLENEKPCDDPKSKECTTLS